MASNIGNATPNRPFTLDRFEQEVADEIGVGRDRTHVTGQQGTIGNQAATRSSGHVTGSTNTNTTSTNTSTSTTGSSTPLSDHDRDHDHHHDHHHH